MEPRQLLAANPIITEVVASNNDSLEDGNGDSSDWIEIYNAGDAPVDLAHWHLTDDPANLDRWEFPSKILTPGEYLIVFASGNDAADAAGNLHTDFQLSSDGEYLALVRPDGTTIASEYSPTLPPQYRDVSYGLPMTSANTTLVAANSPVQVHIPSSGALGASWTEANFSPASGWITESSPGVPATTGVGFETQLSVPGLSAAWSLDDDVGSTTIFDSSDNGHNGTTFGGVVLGATGANPNTGTGVTLTGSGVINVPYSTATNPTTFTATMWVRPTGGTGFRAALTSRYDGLVFGGANLDGYILYAGSDNRWQFWTGDGESAVDTWDTLTGPDVVLNQWTHIALSFDAATNTKRMFVNGVLAASSTTQGYKPVTNAARALHIGGGGDDGNSFRFVGNIDDVGIFSAALDAASIQQVMSAGISQLGSDLITPHVHTNVATPMLGHNASAYLRVPFNVSSPDAFDSLKLRMKYDDGFAAYLNGHLVATRNAPSSLAWNSSATGSRPDNESVEYEDITITSALQYLTAGQNVLAIHGLNQSASDPDFLISPELIASSTTVNLAASGYFTTPTPGAANPSSVSQVPPTISEVGHTPKIPTTSQPLVVTANVAPTTHPIANVRLVYRVMYGAEVTVAMNDSGTGSDAAAGDGVYTGVVPAGVATAGQMLRYYVTAQDSIGALQRAPRLEDAAGADQSQQYYGTVVSNPALSSQLPIFQWFAPDPAAGHTRTGVRASVFYNGEFYDNIFVRQRGQATNSSISQKFDFNDDHLFFVSETVGRVEEINLNAQGADSSYLRQTLAFETWRNAGVPSSDSFLLRMQVNGAFDRVGIYAEQVDEHFLERQGLDPDGALYKFVQRDNLNPVFSDTITGIEKKTRLDEGFADIQSVVAGLALPSAIDRRNFVFDNFDVPELINYIAVRALVQDADDIRKNFYLYRDTNGDGEWSIFPWDKDYTFGVRGDGGPNLDHPFFGEQEHPKLNANQWNVLLDVVFALPETRAMYLRRLRTLMDAYLKPIGTPTDQLVFENRLDELFTQAQSDLALHGVTQATVNGVKTFFPEQRNDFYNTHSIDNVGGPGIVGALVPEFAAGARWFVPTSDALSNTWTARTFVDAAWGTGQTGIGYETTLADYAGLVKTSVDPKRANNQAGVVTCSTCTSTLIRIPFNIPDTTALNRIIANGLTLRMKYDDGFVAFLNGTEVARRNVAGAAGSLVSYVAAATDHPDAAAVVFENIPISAFANQLVVGQNILAIQGVNSSAGSSDMLILPELDEGVPASGDVAGIPHAQAAHPPIEFGAIDYAPASGNQDEEYIELINPGSAAVDLSGWTLTGGVDFTFAPGTVVNAGARVYVAAKVRDFRARTTGPSGNQGLLVVGGYDGHLSSFGETVELKSPDAAVIDTITTPSTPSDVQQFLRISEIMYHPSDPTPGEQLAGFADGDQFEFIELQNVSESAALQLNNVAFSAGIAFTFGDVTLPPGSYAVIVANAAAFAMRYPGVAIAGQYANNLSNGGEAIKLDDADGGTIHDFAYDDLGVDWHPSTDGAGYSLVIIDSAAPPETWSAGASWRPSSALLGSPGSPDTVNVPGDVNGDSRVDLFDLAILQSHFGIVSGASRGEGDVNGDGATNRADAAILAMNFGRISPAPAPATGRQASPAAVLASVNRMSLQARRGGTAPRSRTASFDVAIVEFSPLAVSRAEVRLLRILPR